MCSRRSGRGHGKNWATESSPCRDQGPARNPAIASLGVADRGRDEADLQPPAPRERHDVIDQPRRLLVGVAAAAEADDLLHDRHERTV